MLDIKSNKIDTESTMQCIEILHKQINQVIIMIVELIKTEISKTTETK